MRPLRTEAIVRRFLSPYGPHRRPPLAVLAAMLGSLCLGACAGPGYYWQAARGHLELLEARQDVDVVLADPGTDSQLRQRLQLADEILRFAANRLDLPAEGSYQTLVETGGGPVAWNVVAAPEFSLTPKRWCFPVAGCVSYRAHFQLEGARRAARRLAERGLDVAVFPVQAYSTLGWFEDPLLDSMLAQSPSRLAGSLFHELAHQRFYLRGDTAFSEAYASFMERAGVRHWLTATGREAELERWQATLESQQLFSELLSDARSELAILYESGQDDFALRAGKERIFQGLRSRYEALGAKRLQGWDAFAGWFSGELNNAHLALASAYEGGHCSFEELLRSAGGEFQAFHRRVARVAALDGDQRTAWLEGACPAVASPSEL